uniref:IP09231p n=1 Tax=Drosophila melanogaster TaxID=7227 RepID=Q9VLU3_DROME|nr:uncharacterized protein Dmel_CG12560, isoform B [Drosophila melanogaster]AAF52589.2 uncharacterized protein Dmel_CG12560, isoform B [Drosophila melanogaster]ABM92801.1 IP09231p [Drosophila melanogaster]AOQ14933.1 CG12560-PB [synthetic construct]|eukprot:NP_609173.2 uncharacterized protein Dmel_CG12560, isoform B [Drosophila melanogaster]
MSTENSLVEIPRGEWTKLRDLYVARDTDPQGYPCINNFIKWVEIDPQLKVNFLSLNGDWQSDGTFVLTLRSDTHMNHIYFNTLSENLDRVTKALECLKSIENEYDFFGFSTRLKPVVEYIGNKYYANKKLHTVDTVWYAASKELVDTFNIQVPPGLSLQHLTIEDAEIINENWPHNKPGSIDFVRSLIKYNINLGAYDDKGKLVAWCLRLPIGSLGLLQVLESHKRLGLGSLLVKSMAKKISAAGDQVLAPVVTKNTPSRSMFEKLGFRAIDNTYWAA